MSCKELLTKLYEVIDREASRSDTEEIRKHMEECKNCMSRYQFEGMFKRLVLEKSSQKTSNLDLKKSILDRIDELDSAANNQAGGSFRIGTVIIAAAAAIVICIVSVFSIGKYYRYQEFIKPYEAIHLNNEINSEFQFASAITMSEETDFLVNDLHLVLSTNPDLYSLVDVCSRVVKDVRISHLRMVYDDHYVSILIGNADEVNLPDFNKIEVDGVTYFQHICKRCNMLYKVEGGSIIIALTKDVQVDLVPVVSSFYTI